MVRSASLLFSLLGLFILSGCIRDRVIAPAERMIEKGDTSDFGLEGTWVERLDPNSEPFERQPERLAIVRDENEKGLYYIHGAGLEQHKPRFRVAKYREDADYLIVEFEYEWGESVVRTLGLAIHEGERLHVSWLTSTNLVKSLRTDKHSAVLEHNGFSTIVHADADELVATIRKHGHELKSSSHRTFARATPEAE